MSVLTQGPWALPRDPPRDTPRDSSWDAPETPREEQNEKRKTKQHQSFRPGACGEPTYALCRDKTKNVFTIDLTAHSSP